MFVNSHVVLAIARIYFNRFKCYFYSFLRHYLLFYLNSQLYILSQQWKTTWKKRKNKKLWRNGDGREWRRPVRNETWKGTEKEGRITKETDRDRQTQTDGETERLRERETESVRNTDMIEAFDALKPRSQFFCLAPFSTAEQQRLMWWVHQETSGRDLHYNTSNLSSSLFFSASPWMSLWVSLDVSLGLLWCLSASP